MAYFPIPTKTGVLNEERRLKDKRLKKFEGSLKNGYKHSERMNRNMSIYIYIYVHYRIKVQRMRDRELIEEKQSPKESRAQGEEEDEGKGICTLARVSARDEKVVKRAMRGLYLGENGLT